VNASPIRSLSDRFRQVVLFELGGLLIISPAFAWLGGVSMLDSLGMLALIALIAAIWNGAYNTAFDRIEAGLVGRAADQRPWGLRIVHALGFELGLLVMTLPVVMAWTGLGWWAAIVADVGLVIAYVVYAFVFNIAYDRYFPISSPHDR